MIAPIETVRLRIWCLLRLVAGSALCVFGACTERGAVTVVLHANAGVAPPSYTAIWAHAARVERIACPSPARSGLLSCTRAGVAIADPNPRGELTVKARGYAFKSIPIAGAEPIAIDLARLPAFEANADYRTGFDPKTAQADFVALAEATRGALGSTQSVKFYITGLRSTPRVYFQNTRLHPAHYDFAHDVLGSVLSRGEFNQLTYYGADRDALGGTLTFAPELRFHGVEPPLELRAPIMLEFFPSDDLSPALVLEAHRLLEERLGFAALAGRARRLLYVPAGSQQETELAAAAGRFTAHDAPFADHVALLGGITEQHLNPGLAYGRLRRLEPQDLLSLPVSNRDIVLLTRLPNDLPLVGGSLTEELQTPLAHVDLAARARGTPNAALLGASTDPRVAPWLDRLVRYEVTADGFSLASASDQEAQAFWQAHSPAPLIPASDLGFSGLPAFEMLQFSDAVRVGTKAANLGELRSLLGEQAPDGFAVPFSAYDTYMKRNQISSGACAAAIERCLVGRNAERCDAARQGCERSAVSGDSFGLYVAKLTADAERSADSVLREAALALARDLIAHGTLDPDFAALIDARVGEVFGDAQVRLRSSSNVEDLPGFSGAGLYESVSAYASGERRASERIRDVWASTFNWPAFEERRFWNVDESAVRMGVAVSRAYDGEAVNGVLITRNFSQPSALGSYVNAQAGEIEVTNPENGALPEVFTIVPAPDGGVQVVRERFASLSPATALLSDAEVAALSDAAERCRGRFADLYGMPVTDFALDLEFKLVSAERKLIVKQARPYLEH
jgi:hypothetical protein